MNNEIQPTPEQLAKWREEFEKTEYPYINRMPNGVYLLNSVENIWQGYLRAKQENELSLKEARKQVLEEVMVIVRAEFDGSPYDACPIAICNAIKELLK